MLIPYKKRAYQNCSCCNFGMQIR